MACARAAIALTETELRSFERTDTLFAGRASLSPAAVFAIDASACTAQTVDGTISDGRGACVDLGVGGRGPYAPLEYLPTPSHVAAAVPTDVKSLSQTLQGLLSRRQFISADVPAQVEGCIFDAERVYYLQHVPKVGFGSVIEYSMMFLARATELEGQLVLGDKSSAEWTSEWFCGGERSLNCYFNLSSCCAAVYVDGSELELPRRRNPLNIGLKGFNRFGSAWVSGQLAHFFFSRITARTARQIRRRRDTLLPVRPGAGVIGMHIRGGDSCAARRFCPSNASVYFEQAARLRDRYGAGRVLLATDDAAAAAMCAGGPFGLRCDTLRIGRKKFESHVFIENRVAQHTEGPLSGSAVALDALADVDMLADCDYFVLLFRSAISRLAYALALARRGRAPPVVSMQWPWSSAHMKTKLKKKLLASGASKDAHGG